MFYGEFTEKLPEIPHVPEEVLVIRTFVYTWNFFSAKCFHQLKESLNFFAAENFYKNSNMSTRYALDGNFSRGTTN